MIEILAYQPRWRQEFAVIAGRLREGLGPLAVRIDHIGSTSVPGLPAKDVIDVQITVEALDDRFARAMAALGYVRREGMSDHRPPGATGSASAWAKWFFFQPAGERRANVHVRVQGAANQRYPLLFRDYLRAHPAPAAAYAELKRRLAQHLADPETYPDVKDPAVDLIYFAAEAWSEAVGWEPGPSDE